MKPNFTNIEQALKADRPTDKIIKILNNKFAIVQSAFTNGTFDVPSLCGLDNGKVYFYGHQDRNSTKFGFVKQYAKKVVDTMPNCERKLVGYNHLAHYVLHSQNNKHYKKAFRKILKLEI